ncbi:MAG TPA: protein kinase [Candidatus Bathyarchaeia archaeon]|nr:protein kinase [Candidatus Bathyarchaeia archaeon]
MKPEQWERVAQLHRAALDIDEDARAAFLREVCAGDEELRREVESLLSLEADAENFMDGSALQSVAQQLADEQLPLRALSPGAKLGPFVILGELGAGGMGEVYRARDSSLKREVAIKVLPASYSRDPDRLRRFELEAQAAAALNHSNILSILHIGEHDGWPYIVSELLEGETLGDHLRRGPMRRREAVDVSAAVARGLAAAHEKGIIHRDLKPDNLFLAKDGRVKILDFGLAKLTQVQAMTTDGRAPTVAAKTNPGLVMGTVGYMSPEQVRGQSADARSDIFALGSVLYEMLTGKRAFQKPTTAETMSAILNEDPPELSQSTGKIPPGLQRVMRRCLEKNPELRFQSASDLAFALEALSDSGSATTVVGGRESLRRILAWTTATLVVAAAVILLWWRVPPDVPRVVAIAQLTDDGEAKCCRLATDGSRIYFNEGSTGSFKLAQVAVTGGPTGIIPTSLEDPYLLALAPEGTGLLVGLRSGKDKSSSFPLWRVPLPVGEAHHFGSLKGPQGGFFPDGRIVFGSGTDFYAAEKDGSDPRKLFTASGHVGEPQVAPDGERIAFNSFGESDVSVIVSKLDGKTIRRIPASCCARWTPDGRYIVFSNVDAARKDLWALSAKAGIFRGPQQPVRLTNGPLSYGGSGVVLSGDGKRIFAIGKTLRGELVRYDTKLKRFVPFLPGVSASSPAFSSDGKWVAYLSYPDRTLWRSRVDGTERLQLSTSNVAADPFFISPTGKQILFTGDGGIFTISMEVGESSPQKIIGDNSEAVSWSPDGKSLLLTSRVKGKAYLDENSTYFQTMDLQSGKLSVIPGSDAFDIAHGIGGWWLAPDLLIASAPDKLVTFNFKAQKWSDLLLGDFVSCSPSTDLKYLYCATGGTEPKALRIRVADRTVETVTSLQELRRTLFSHEISVAPDGSPVFTRDVGSQEIYALTVEWP